MKRIKSLIVKYHQETIGTLALSVDGKVCTFSTTSNGLLQVLAYLHKVYKKYDLRFFQVNSVLL